MWINNKRTKLLRGELTNKQGRNRRAVSFRFENPNIARTHTHIHTSKYGLFFFLSKPNLKLFKKNNYRLKNKTKTSYEFFLFSRFLFSFFLFCFRNREGVGGCLNRTRISVSHKNLHCVRLPSCSGLPLSSFFAQYGV